MGEFRERGELGQRTMLCVPLNYISATYNITVNLRLHFKLKFKLKLKL